MFKTLKRINKILPDLILIVLGYGLLAEAVGLLFVKDRIYYSVGLFVGIALAMGMAVHMALVIEDSLSVHDKRGQVRITLKGILRYAVVVIVVFVVVYFDLGSMPAIFLGVMGLKISAYLQPKIRDIIFHKNSRQEVNK